jgi:hypothetical protein
MNPPPMKYLCAYCSMPTSMPPTFYKIFELQEANWATIDIAHRRVWMFPFLRSREA